MTYLTNPFYGFMCPPGHLVIRMIMTLKTLAGSQRLWTKAVKVWVFAGPPGGRHGPSVPPLAVLEYRCAPGHSWTTWVARSVPILWSWRSRSACNLSVWSLTLSLRMACAQLLHGVTGVRAAPLVVLACASGLDCLLESLRTRRNVNAGL